MAHRESAPSLKTLPHPSLITAAGLENLDPRGICRAAAKARDFENRRRPPSKVAAGLPCQNNRPSSVLTTNRRFVWAVFSSGAGRYSIEDCRKAGPWVSVNHPSRRQNFAGLRACHLSRDQARIENGDSSRLCSPDTPNVNSLGHAAKRPIKDLFAIVGARRPFSTRVRRISIRKKRPGRTPGRDIPLFAERVATRLCR